MLQEAFVQLVMEQEGDKILRTTRVWRNGGLRLKLKFRLSIPQKANYIDFFLKFIQLIGFCLLCR